MPRMRKTIAILLAVLFLVTVTAGAVSAGGWGNWGRWNISTVKSEIGHNVAGVTYNAESAKNIPIAATSTNILTTSILGPSIEQFQAHGGWGK